MNVYMKKWIKYIGITATIGLCVTFSIQPILAFAGYENLDEQQAEIVDQEQNKESSADLTHEEIVSLTDEFLDVILQDIDDDYKVIQYETKDELLDEFENRSTHESAEPYVEVYFNETEDGLYIIPTETPPWFNPDNDYDIISSDRFARVIQENETDLDGTYTIQYDFIYEEDGWKISKIEHL